jgi:hypothetical protein
MNPNLKTATLSVAWITLCIWVGGVSLASAAPGEWDDQNSDKSWNASSPVVAPAADPLDSETSAQAAPIQETAKSATKPIASANQPAASASVISSKPAPIAASNTEIEPKAAPVSFDVPLPPTAPNHLTSISKSEVPGDLGTLALSSPYVHSEPRAVAPFPILLNESVQNYVEDFLDQPASLKLAFERSRPFRRDMMATLKKEGLPDDLVYLTFAESDFSKQGKGPWQFSAETAARFGLRVNKWIDERRDPIRSTQAAAEYLAELHDQADNDWRVALIAWNTGEANLQRYWSLEGANYTKFADRLPRRTRQLLNRFMAVAFIAHNAKAYGLDEAMDDDDAPTWTVAKVKGGTLLSSIAAKFRTSVSKLHDLNPALRADRVPPNVRTYGIRVPAVDLEDSD